MDGVLPHLRQTTTERKEAMSKRHILLILFGVNIGMGIANLLLSAGIRCEGGVIDITLWISMLFFILVLFFLGVTVGFNLAKSYFRDYPQKLTESDHKYGN